MFGQRFFTVGGREGEKKSHLLELTKPWNLHWKEAFAYSFWGSDTKHLMLRYMSLRFQTHQLSLNEPFHFVGMLEMHKTSLSNFSSVHFFFLQNVAAVGLLKLQFQDSKGQIHNKLADTQPSESASLAVSEKPPADTSKTHEFIHCILVV